MERLHRETRGDTYIGRDKEKLHRERHTKRDYTGRDGERLIQEQILNFKIIFEHNNIIQTV